MNHSEHYDYLKAQSPSTGTTVTVDWREGGAIHHFQCACGGSLKISSYEYTYYIECPECREVFAMPLTLEPIKLPEAHRKYVLKERDNLVACVVDREDQPPHVGKASWRMPPEPEPESK